MTAVLDTLNPAQRFVADARMLETGYSCVLQLPTGSGKTWLARQAIRLALQRGMRAVYLTPIRALADELCPQWQAEFAPTPVGVFTGDYGQGGKDYPVPFGKARLLIMTPERLDASTRAWRSHWQWIPEVDLIVVDEVHLLGDRNRGSRLEGAISRFRRLNPFCRFLCLSATLGNREELADWLGGVEYESEWRAVPLSWRVVRYRKADEKPDILVTEINRTRAFGGRSLVFVQSRRRCEMLASHLTTQGIRADYHHAGLAHSSRRKVEKNFRDAELDALIATGTLEMGLNMPVRQVILYDTQAFDGNQFAPLSVNTVWQRAGRAGRPGLDPSGEAVIMVPTWDKSSDSYIRGRFERVESSLGRPAALAEQIVAEVGSRLCRSETQLERALNGSLAAFQKKAFPVPQILDEMLDAGMVRRVESEDDVEEESGKLAVTALGRIATRQLLQPKTVLMMKRFLEATPFFTHFDVLFSLSLTPDNEPVIPVDFEELSSMVERLDGVPSYLSQRLNHMRPILPDVSGKRILSAMKSALVLLSWCRTGDEDETAEVFGLYPFEVTRLRESVERLLTATAAVSKFVFAAPQDEKESEPAPKPEATRRLDLLRSMIVTGLPPRTASLALIDGVGPKWARKLHDLGFNDLSDLANAGISDFAGISGLSAKRALTWIEEARALSLEPIPSREENAPRIQLDNLDILTPNIAASDPYRARRSLELKVENGLDGALVVSGGLEPHRVHIAGEIWKCDCADHANGHVCKHILAARRYGAESSIEATETGGATAATSTALNLLAFWSER